MTDVGQQKRGNAEVNATSVGIEHEGVLTAPGAGYTEAMYRASARPARHLVQRCGISLDRQHVIGHDNVQGRPPRTSRARRPARGGARESGSPTRSGSATGWPGPRPRSAPATPLGRVQPCRNISAGRGLSNW
ncbi:N-acetylmuramoyl-L-alanine amidase [Streptomyces sp. ME01-24h]|nr:N-acetylmuramoyl-L-alanine amidase [Streptomyces sp. ME19-03-3]MDX3352165.1 N-acetylmuramoyl-L-alanine amidase [Streptomyces sp. ME01-24h]